MRQLSTRNQKAAEHARDYAAKRGVDLRPIELDVGSQASVDAAIVRILADRRRPIVAAVEVPDGKRPYRVHIDPADDGSSLVSVVADHIRADFLHRIGLSDLLTVRTSNASSSRSPS